MKNSYLFFALLFSVTLSAQNTYTAPDIGDLVINDCNGILYDSGGPDGLYTENNEAFITINGTSGDALLLSFTEFDVEDYFDDLTIYDGPTTDSPIVGIYSGASLPNNGNQILLSGTTCLLVFNSDFSINGDGFAMNFDCFDFTEPPVAGASYPGQSCTGTVAFADASTFFPTSWTWDFGDGNTSTEQNPVHTYTEPGTYDIQLEVCNDNGCDTLSLTEAITYDPDNFACTNGFTMPLHGSETTSLCNGVLFDNGGIDGDYANGSNDQFLIIPPGGGSITITFTAFDLGSSTTNNDQLSLFGFDGTNYTPLATYLGSDLPNNGQPITFQTSGLVVFFYSDHENSFPGFEMIWEASGIANPPSASFTADMTSVAFGTAIQFTDTSTENPGIWNWDFGDGNTSNEQNPGYVYSEAGTYNVSLTVTNCNSSDTSIPLTITVQEPPAITYDPDSFIINLEAGTSATELLNLCNVGQGDLVTMLSVLGEGNQTGYVLDFITSDEGEGFSWQLFDEDNVVIAENNQTYAANSTYSETISGLEPGVFYYFWITGIEEDAVVFDAFTLSDLGTGTIWFSTFVEFVPDQLYYFPSLSTGPGSVPDWLSLGTNSNPLAAATCEDITVTFDATELVEGTYEGSINITSNDPNNPLITIPVTLIVNGTPALSISTNDLDFGELPVGGTSTLSFTLENTGTAAADVSGLESSITEFDVQSTDNVVLAPNESLDISVSFVPGDIAVFTETLTLVNNAGDDLLVNLTGSGIAAPSLTVNPTEFIVELIEGQDTILTVDVGNVGEAPLDFTVSASSNSTGFIFNFTTDTWGPEFSWNLLNSNNEIVQSSEGITYQSNTTYTVALTGLSENESYTLQLLDSWGDGALPSYSVVDALSGQVVAEGAFIGNLFEELVALGAPGTEFAGISPTSGTVEVNESTQLLIDMDATGLATGMYNLVYELNTNDPLQPLTNITVTLYVIAPVTANVDATDFVCGTLPVQFTDASTNVPTSWSWDFGDGTTSTEQNPVHTYTESGIYTITLEACNTLGCDVISLTDFIEVDIDCYTQNIPQHGNEVVTVCSGNLYDSGGPDAPYLEGSFGSITIAPPGATSISITFSEFNYQEHDFLLVYDGLPGTGILLGSFTGNELEGQTLTAASGVLTVQEYTDHFINLSGFSATFNCEAPPPVAPKALFSVVENEVCANESVVFEDQSLDFPTSWFWEFGDGGTSNEQNPIYFYSESGTYMVTLTACNAFGCNTVVQDINIVIDQDCVIETMPANGQQSIIGCSGTLYDSGGLDSNYVDNSTGVTTIYSPAGPITLEFVSFSFEDGFDGIFIFDGPGTEDPLLGFFTGTELPESITSTGSVITIVENTDLTTNDSGFQINYSCQGGSLGDLGGAQIRVNNEEMCDGIRSFGVNTSADVESWSWDFGDGHTSTQANPEHTFSHNGVYNIAVTICKDGNCESIETMIYSNKLTPEITAPDTVALGQEVQLHGLTSEATHWYWEFGNGETANHATPVTTYTEAGWYDIHVHLINMDVHETCDANHTHTIFVDANLTSTDAEELLDFTVFPNPATDQLNLRGLEGWDEDCEIRLRSMVGQVVRIAPLGPSISLANLPSGMYVLEIVEGEQLLGRTRVVKE